MKLAIYPRVSTERQAEEGMSIDRQTALMEEWAAHEKHVVVEIFRELGASASEDKHRPVFERMIEKALSPEHPFDAIVVFSLSRFYRDNVARAVLAQRLKRASVRVISYSQPLPEDESLAYLIENIIGLIDEFQSRETSKFTSGCMRSNADKGFFNGARPPYGYKAVCTDVAGRGHTGFKKKLQIDEEEAEVVKLILDLAEHMSLYRSVGVTVFAQ